MNRLKYRTIPEASWRGTRQLSLKELSMSEPISGTAAGVFGWKVIGGLAGITGVGAGLAAYVVMSMTKPRTNQEWHVALISTLMGSIGGGSALVMYLDIQHWADKLFGMMGLLGICFACGLPAWLLVRALFVYIEKKKDADLSEIIRDVKEVI